MQPRRWVVKRERENKFMHNNRFRNYLQDMKKDENYLGFIKLGNSIK